MLIQVFLEPMENEANFQIETIETNAIEKIELSELGYVIDFKKGYHWETLWCLFLMLKPAKEKQ